MVTKFSAVGTPYREPPYSKKEIAQFEAEGFYGTPKAIIRSERDPTGQQPAEGSPPEAARSAPTLKRAR